MERYNTRKLIKRFNEVYNYSLTLQDLLDAYEIPLTKAGRMNRRYKKRINEMRNDLITEISQRESFAEQIVNGSASVANANANAVANANANAVANANANAVLKPSQEDLQKALNALNELREYNSTHEAQSAAGGAHKINLKQYILYKPMIEELKGTVADRLNLSIPQKFELLHKTLHLNVETEHGSSGHVTSAELYINGDADGTDETILRNTGLSGFKITNIAADKSNDVEVEEIVGIYANDNMNCVDVFKDYYGINDERFPGREALLRKLYNGIQLSDFIEIVDDLGICEVYDNYRNKLNKTVSNNKAMYFNNHIIPTLPKEPAAKKVEVMESITDLYLRNVKYHEFMTNIKIYNEDVSSFETATNRYVKRTGDRNIAFAEYCKKYGCAWFNNYEKNAIIYNQHEGEKFYQVDCVRAYSNAYFRTKRIPIISNIRTKYPSSDYIVCVEIINKFQLLLTKKNFEKYRSVINMKVLYYQRVIEWKKFEPKALRATGEALELSKQDINELLGCCLISGQIKRVQLITQHMHDLKTIRRTLNKHYYPITNSYLCNLHFAVMNNFYPLMFDLFKYNPIVFNVDSLYFSKENYENVIKHVKNKEDYHFNDLQTIKISKVGKNISRNHQIVVAGPAGSGKTHLIRETIKGGRSPRLYPRSGLRTPEGVIEEPYKPLIMSTTNRLQNLWEGYNYSTLTRILKRHQLPEAEIYVIDEAYQCNNEDLSNILGALEYHNLTTVLIGDRSQFQAVGLTADERFEISNMKTSAVLFSNYRNDINYSLITGSNIKEYFDKYITCCDYDENKANYAYLNATMNKYEGKKYYKAKATVSLRTKSALCASDPKGVSGMLTVYNGEYYDYEKLNNILLSVPPVLKPTSIKSIYTTQGQTMKDIRVLKDDYDKYISNLTLCYVLISRICNGKKIIDPRDEQTRVQVKNWIDSHVMKIYGSTVSIEIYDDTLEIREYTSDE